MQQTITTGPQVGLVADKKKRIGKIKSGEFARSVTDIAGTEDWQDQIRSSRNAPTRQGLTIIFLVMYQTKGPGDIEQAKNPEGRIDGEAGPIVYGLTPFPCNMSFRTVVGSARLQKKLLIPDLRAGGNCSL